MIGTIIRSPPITQNHSMVGEIVSMIAASAGPRTYETRAIVVVHPIQLPRRSVGKISGIYTITQVYENQGKIL